MYATAPQDDLIDDEANDKLQRDLDVADNNIKLFREMLENWSPADGPLQVGPGTMPMRI